MVELVREDCEAVTPRVVQRGHDAQREFMTRRTYGAVGALSAAKLSQADQTAPSGG